LQGERLLNKKIDAKIENEFFEEGHILVDANKICNRRSYLGADIDQRLNKNKIHFLYGPKGFVGLGYRHRHPICPIIQHILIPNINKVVHKFIGW
jgi:hypothetical protein